MSSVAVAKPDTESTNATSTIVFSALTNDSDTMGYSLSILSVNTNGTKGLVSFNASTGQITYSPDGAFDHLSVGEKAIDTYQYTIKDSHGNISTATDTVTITGVNFAPVATPIAITTPASTSIWISAAALDTDPNRDDTLTITALNLTGTEGTAVFNPSYNTGFDYSPNGMFSTLSAGETATDTFHYTVSDNHGATSTGVVTVTVTGVNQPPTDTNYATTTFNNQSTTVSVLANAADINADDTLTVSSVSTTGSLGTATITDGGTTVTYTPTGAGAALAFGQTATDTVRYTVSDGHGGTTTASITVSIWGALPSSDLLGSGYLSTKGSQYVNAAGQIVRIVSIGWPGTDGSSFAPAVISKVNYQQTMQEMLHAGFNTIRIPWSDALLTASPAAGSINYSANPDLQGLNSIQVLQKIVAYAGQIGLKIIFDHHNNEGCGNYQPSGLWYDVGGASNGTDGAGHTGTVTQQTFQNDWISFAKLWAGNSTVIGYDLANEPLAGTWTGPSTTSVQTMATTVGDALQAIDPGKLIIVESAGSTTDLSAVGAAPVVLNTPNKVVYSVHEYPQSVSPTNFSGNPTQYIQQMNAEWGYLVTGNIAPVWIGELGSNLQTASDQLWGATLMNYMNGDYAAEGGPIVSGSNQGVSGDYWGWNYGTGEPDGILESNLVTLKPDQYALAQQLVPASTTTAATTTKVSNSLILSMQQDYYNGDAQFTVWVDGAQVGGTQTVNKIDTRANNQIEQFYLSGSFAAGTHTVTVTYLNDAYGGSTSADRNLFVTGMTFDGAAQRSASGALLTDGSLNFSVSATGTVTTPNAPDTIILQASDNASGSSFQLYVDGQQIGGTQTLTALTANGDTQTFAFAANLGGGSHEIDIKQLNAVTGGSTINVTALDYDGTLQSITQTNALGTQDQLYTVTAGSVLNGGTIDLGNDTANVVLTQPNQMVFMAAGTHSIEADASGFTLQDAGGIATITHFNTSLDHIDLVAGLGGFAVTSQVVATLASDSSGGTMLNLGNGDTLDFVNIAKSSFTASTFQLS